MKNDILFVVYADFIFDKYISKTHFKFKGKFSNKSEDLKKFISKSDLFFVCIGMMDGKIRSFISKKLKKLNLKELSILSDNALIDKTAKYGDGTLVMPNAVVHKYTPDGELQFTWGESGTDPGQFSGQCRKICG